MLSRTGWVALLALLAMHAVMAKKQDPYALDPEAKGPGKSPIVLVAGVMGTKLDFLPNYTKHGFRSFINRHLDIFLARAKTSLGHWRWHGRRFAALGGDKKYLQSREIIRKWVRVARLHKDSSRAYREFVTTFCHAARNTRLTSYFDLGALDANALIQWLHNDGVFMQHKDGEKPRDKLIDVLVLAYEEAFLKANNKSFWLNKEWFGGYLSIVNRDLSSWVNTEDNLFAYVAGLEYKPQESEFVAALPGVDVVPDFGAAVPAEYWNVCKRDSPFDYPCPRTDGLAGIEHLSSQKLIRLFTKDDTFVELIEWLVEEQGYTRGKDLLAQPYDWRLSPQQEKMHEGLRNRIIHAYYNGGRRPVTILAHSMGTIYTLHALQQLDQRFKDKYVHSFIAAGGPLAGAAEVIDGIVQGTKHLDKLVDREYMRSLQRMVGPLYLMAPREGANVEFTGSKNILYTEEGTPLDTSGSEFVKWDFKDKTVFQFKDRKYTGSDADLEALFTELNAPNKHEGTLLFNVQDAEVRSGGLFDRKRDMMAVMTEAGEYAKGKPHSEWSTFVVKNNNSPVWLDSVTLGYTDNQPPEKIVLKLVDDDGVGMDEAIGTATFFLRKALEKELASPPGLGYLRMCMDADEVTGDVKELSACFVWYWAAETPGLRKWAGHTGEDMRYPRRLKMLERECMLNQMCALPTHALDIFHLMREVNKGYPYPGVETLCAYSDSEDTIDSISYENNARYQRMHLEKSAKHSTHPGDGTVPRYSAQAPCTRWMAAGKTAGLVRSSGTHGGMKHHERMLSFLKTHLASEKKVVHSATTTVHTPVVPHAAGAGEPSKAGE